MAKRKFVNFIPRPKPRKRPRRHSKKLNKNAKRSYKKYNRQGRKNNLIFVIILLTITCKSITCKCMNTDINIEIMRVSHGDLISLSKLSCVERRIHE